MYCKQLREDENSANLLPITNDKTGIQNKLNDINVDHCSRLQDRKWRKLSLVLVAAILSKILTSDWLLSSIVCVDYLLYETIQYLSQFQSRLYPSDSNRLIAYFKIILFIGMLGCTCAAIPMLLFKEISTYLKFMLDSEDDPLCLKYKILKLLVPIFDDYLDYWMILFGVIFVFVVPRYL